MPRSTKSSTSGTPSTTSGDSWKYNFVSCEPSEEQREYVRNNLLSVVEIGDFIEEMAADHYKLTIYYDKQSDCFSAILVGQTEQAINKGLAVSARAPSFVGLITMLSYKHYEIMNEDWREHTGKKTRGGWG